MDLFHVDAFTDSVFAGNPAAVVLVDRPVSDAFCQAVAAEMNLAETAFVSEGEPQRPLRWFTPTVEVELCGHATLASAHVLFEAGVAGPIRFWTRSGELTVTKEREVLEMDFPATAINALPRADGIEEALGTAVVAVHAAGSNWLVELADEATLRAIAPDRSRVLALSCSGVIVTARATENTGADFVSRFFVPKFGIDEDPVTGSAHCALGPFWSRRLGRDDLTGYQASSRGGTVGVKVRGERVLLSGNAVTVAIGSLL